MNWLQKISGLSDDALNKLHETGNQVVEQATAGSYELFLVHYSHGPINLYQLALQRTGLDFTNVHHQIDRHGMPDNIVSEMQSLDEIKAIINQWRQKYGELVVKSHFSKKDVKYLNILQWLGFTTSTKSIMGNNVIVI